MYLLCGIFRTVSYGSVKLTHQSGRVLCHKQTYYVIDQKARGPYGKYCSSSFLQIFLSS